MPLKIEGIVDGGMHTQEALRGARRLESLHLALSPSHRLMRVLGWIVAPDPLFVRAAQPQLPGATWASMPEFARRRGVLHTGGRSRPSGI